jgi:hypothetical protein
MALLLITPYPLEITAIFKIGMICAFISITTTTTIHLFFE